MEDNKTERYLSAMIRIKNAGMKFPQRCDIQWSEHLVMKKICRDCIQDDTYVNVSEIHADMYISKPAVSQTLNSLEKKGYIVRGIDVGDRRRISVKPTSEGTDVLIRSSATYEEKIHFLFEQLGNDQMDTLLDLMNKLVDIVDDIEDI